MVGPQEPAVGRRRRQERGARTAVALVLATALVGIGVLWRIEPIPSAGATVGASSATAGAGAGAGERVASGASGRDPTTTTAAPALPPELPRGGRVLFPDHRVVAFYGTPGTARLGVLGSGPLDEVMGGLSIQAGAYETPERPVLPAFELIATIAQSAPGDDGTYSAPIDPAEVQAHLDAVRKADGLLVLDIQPGSADVLDEVKRYEEFLRQPDVGLALDSEWVSPPGRSPGEATGSMDAATVNEVSTYLAELVAAEDLPEKLFVLHLFKESMITDRASILDRDGLATVFHVDGFGGQEVKRSKYDQLHGVAPFASGFKLFYDLDTGLLTPEQVVAMVPSPDLVTYQ